MSSIATKYKKIEKPVGEGTYGVSASACFSFALAEIVIAARALTPLS